MKLHSLNSTRINAREVDFQSISYEENPTMSVSKIETHGDFVVSLPSPIFFFNFVISLPKGDCFSDAKEILTSMAKETLSTSFEYGFDILKTDITYQDFNNETLASAIFQIQPLLYGTKTIQFSIQEHQFLRPYNNNGVYEFKLLENSPIGSQFLFDLKIDQELLTDFVIHKTLSQFMPNVLDIVEVHENDLHTRRRRLYDCLVTLPNMVMIETTIKETPVIYSQKNINTYSLT